MFNGNYDGPGSAAIANEYSHGEALSPPSGSVAKAHLVLSALSTAGPVLGVSELSRRTGLAKSTTHRVLSGLASVGMVERAAAGYQLSRGLGDLTNHAASWSSSRLRERILPILLDLYEQTHHTVRLIELRGTQIICLENLHRHGRRYGTLGVGESMPAERSVVGRLLLAYADGAVLAQLLSDQSPGGAGDVQMLRSELARIKAVSAAIDRGRIEHRITTVAVPLYSSGNHVFAAVSLSGIEQEFDTRGSLWLLRKAAVGIHGTRSSDIQDHDELQEAR